MATFFEELQRRMIDRQMTHRELAHHLDDRVQMVHFMVTGQALPNPKDAQKIAEVLGCTTDDLGYSVMDWEVSRLNSMSMAVDALRSSGKFLAEHGKASVDAPLAIEMLEGRMEAAAERVAEIEIGRIGRKSQGKP